MTCPEFREWLDDLLLRDPDEAPPADVSLHLAGCDECSREHALALETLQLIAPGALVVASPRLKQRILDAIPAASLDASPSTKGIALLPAVHPWRRRAVRVRLAIALAAAAVLAMILFPIGVGLFPNSNSGALSLLAQAEAAEARLFAADATVSLTSEIVVEPVADATLIEARWLPIVSVGADGQEHCDQLKLGGDPGEGYTVRDDAWYDPATRRFAHVLSLKGRPLFANSYDGRSVHRLELDAQGRATIKDEAVAPGFGPKDPAGFLGILGALTGSKEDAGRHFVVRDAGPTKLADGTRAHMLRVSIGDLKDNKLLPSYVQATIRDDDHRVESLEFFALEKKLYTVRRAGIAGRPEPEYGWDLAGLRPAIEKDRGGAKSPVRTIADMVRPDVTVEEMAKRADYAVYVFGRDPSWTARRRIMDILDLPSPPHRLFTIVYPAKDKRHVVLVQAHTFNAMLGPKVHAGKLIYTSPAGIKVWSDKDGQKMAEILVSSALAIAEDAGSPAKDRTCYLLETPEGTFPALAINGTLTDAELHGLVDSLELARPK